MKNKILVLVPTLGRPASLLEFVASFVATNSGLADLLLLPTINDREFTLVTGPHVESYAHGFDSFAHALNSVHMSKLAEYEVLGWLANDVRCRTPGWDKLIWESLRDRIGMAYGRDGIQDGNLGTHPFWSSKVTQALGFVVPPRLHHYYVDNFIHTLFVGLGSVQYLPQLLFEHLHYTVSKSVEDDVYRLGSSWWQQDTDTWNTSVEPSIAGHVAALKHSFKIT